LHDWLTKTKFLIFQILAEFSYPPNELVAVGVDWDKLNLDPAATG
jgi:hypothetical protein